MSEVRKVPRLRFKNDNGSGFPNWILKSFSEIYEFESTNSFSRDKLNYEDGEVKNIHYGDIHTKFRSRFKVQDELVPFVNPEIDLKKFKTTNFLKSGDLVIADASEDYGDIGKSIEIIDTNGEKIVSGLHTIHGRKISDEIIVGFSSFLMNCQRVRKSIMMIAQGTKVLSISSKRLGEISLLFPSPSEQKKISEFLTSVDRRIELLEKKKSLLETYKKGVMKKIFSQEIRFKADDGNDFPDWEEKRFREIGEPFNGLSGKTKEDFNHGTSNYIQYKQVFGKSYIDVSEFGIVNVQESENQSLVQFGDILFTTSSETPDEVGMSSVFLDRKLRVYLNSFCFGFRPNSLSILYPEFSKYIFRNDEVRSKIIKLGQGSTRYNISKSKFLKLEIMIPSLIEQIKISSFLNSVDLQIEILGSQIEKSRTWKKGLLQKMFV